MLVHFVCCFLLLSPRAFLEQSPETHRQSSTELFQITPLENEVITSFSGIQYPRLQFGSHFYSTLCKRLRDVKKSERMICAYQKLLPALHKKKELQVYFEQWIEAHLPLLGCYQKSQEKLRQDPFLNAHQALLDPFLASIGCQEHSHVDRVVKRPSKIVILTSSAGGGEQMVARALRAHLQEQGFDVTLLDIKEIQKEADTFYLYSGMQHEDIYSEIFQKENNYAFAYKLTNLAEALLDYIPDNTYGVIKEKIRALQPDCILSTRYSYPNDISFAYDLHVPLRFVHCDYRLSPELALFLDKIDPTLVRFWLPEALSSHPHVEVVGYPVRAPFDRKYTQEELMQLRQKHAIPLDRKVVLMMMGLHGVGKTMLEFLKQLKMYPERLSVILICGDNAAMRDEIAAYAKEHALSHTIDLHVHGLVEADELAEYFNIADGFVGKAGGSTTSELIAVGLPAIQFTSFTGQPRVYEWEEANLRYLRSIGLGIHMKEPRNFLRHLHALLQLKKQRFPTIDWKKAVLTNLKRDLE